MGYDLKYEVYDQIKIYLFTGILVRLDLDDWSGYYNAY
jgi:hypothetical protein